MKTAAEARENASRPRLPREARYALLRRPDLTLDRPLTFRSLNDLAQAVHHARQFGAIELLDAGLMLRDDLKPRAGVSIWRLGPDGSKAAYLGWAYLGGAAREALKAALMSAHPVAEQAEAA